MWEYKREIKDKWIKSAALASIWASIEIVFGSFLHNIHAPLAGTVLTVTSVILMTVFGFYWKEKGIFWRAGLITALMKSISPSAVLIGPMTAIFAEGLLFELGVWLLGKNYLGFALGGVLAVASALVHKVLVLLVLYGMKLVPILRNLYYFVIKQLRIDNLTFTKAIVLLFVIYCILGIVSVTAAYFLAKKVRKKKEDKDIPQLSQQLRIEDRFWKTTDEQKHSIWALLLLIVIGVFMLWVVEKVDLRLVTISVLLFVTVQFFFYPQAFRYFKKRGFWIQIAIIFVITVLFYNGFNEHRNFLNKEGFIVAIRLIYRVVILIVTFSALSMELRNPIVKAVLFRLGFSHLYYALVLAFSALPTFFNEISYVRKYLKLNALIGLVFITDELVRAFKGKEVNRKVYVISGCKDCGKTTFAKKMVEQLRNLGLSVGGFVTEKQFSNEGFTDYYVKDLNSDRKALLCTNQRLENYIFKTAKLYFSSYGLSLGMDILEDTGHPLVLIDEVGNLELKGLAWSDSIEKLFFTNSRQIWVVRDRYVNSVLKKFFITEAKIFEIDTDLPSEAANVVLHNILQQ